MATIAEGLFCLRAALSHHPILFMPLVTMHLNLEFVSNVTARYAAVENTKEDINKFMHIYVPTYHVLPDSPPAILGQ